MGLPCGAGSRSTSVEIWRRIEYKMYVAFEVFVELL